MTKWKCEPCGHVSEEKPRELCLICGSENTAVVKIVIKGGHRQISRVREEK